MNLYKSLQLQCICQCQCVYLYITHSTCVNYYTTRNVSIGPKTFFMSLIGLWTWMPPLLHFCYKIKTFRTDRGQTGKGQGQI